MGYFVFITFIGSAAYLIFCYDKQKQAEKKRIELINESRFNYEKAKADHKTVKDGFFECIATFYSREEANKIADGTIWVGMDSDFLIAVMGIAEEIKDSYVRGARVEKWYYLPYWNRLNNKKYSFEVTVENGQVSGWKDLV